MLSIVTGAAGFIGSHLCEALLARGDTVRGIDAFTDYYDPAIKRRNIAGCLADARFSLHEIDLRTAALEPVLDGADVVFHQAAQPGVRLSWAEHFPLYDAHNIGATHRLLEAVRERRIARTVFASSSSVYGNAASYPCREDDPTEPFSPYGVTKLAGEHLARAYAANFGVGVACLRYFTVYGPRQRPDMAFNRLIQAGLDGSAFPLNGDGSAIRDFTYVGDVVRANLAASDADLEPGVVVNVAGGGSERMGDLIELAGELLGRPIAIDRRDAVPGDVARTGGSVEKAARLLGWKPEVDVAAGLAAQIDWQRSAPSPDAG